MVWIISLNAVRVIYTPDDRAFVNYMDVYVPSTVQFIWAMKIIHFNLTVERSLHPCVFKLKLVLLITLLSVGRWHHLHDAASVGIYFKWNQFLCLIKFCLQFSLGVVAGSEPRLSPFHLAPDWLECQKSGVNKNKSSLNQVKRLLKTFGHTELKTNHL